MDQCLFDEYASYSNDFEHEFGQNLKQIRRLIDYLNNVNLNNAKTSLEKLETLSTNSSNSSSNATSTSNSSIDSLNAKLGSYSNSSQHFKSLDDLCDYYKKLESNAVPVGELKFVQYLLYKKLNHLNNTLFNLNKKLDLNIASSISFSPLNQLHNYEKVEQFESNLRSKNVSHKLLISSINLSQFYETQMISDLSKDDEFKLSVFQFEKQNVKIIMKENQSKNSVNGHKNDNKSTNFKRSSSADTRTPKPQKLTSIYIENDLDLNLDTSAGSNEIESEKSDAEDFLSSSNSYRQLSPKFRLNEKCLKKNSLIFNKALSNNVHTSIDLDQSCKKILIILYKIVKLNENSLFLPIKYETYELSQDNSKLILTASFLVPFLSTEEKEMSNKANSEPSSSVFKRIFKSKSSSRRTPSTRFRSKAREEKLEPNSDFNSESFLTLQISSSNQCDFFLNESNLLNIDLFDYWRNLWRPTIQTNDLRLRFSNDQENKFVEYVNLTICSFNFNTDSGLNTNSIAAPIRRSKFDQYQMAKKNKNFNQNREQNKEENIYYYLRFRTTNETFYSSLFASNEKIDDLFQFELENNLLKNCLSFQIEVYKLINFASSKLVGSHEFNLNYEDFYTKNNSKIISISSQSNKHSLKLKFIKFSHFEANKNVKSVETFNLIGYRNYLSEDCATIDLDKLEIYLDKLLLDPKNNDSNILRYLMALFSHLNTKNVHSSKQDLKRELKTRVMLKTYDLLIRMVHELKAARFDSFYSCLEKYSSCEIHPKQIVSSVLTILKNVFDADLFASLTYEFTLESFDKIVKFLIDMAKINDSSLYDLKYNLNDLLLNKLCKKLKDNQMKMFLFCSKLNLNFLNFLLNDKNDLFNGFELANISIKLLSLDQNNENIMNIFISLVSLELFNKDFQFRDRLFDHLVANLRFAHHKQSLKLIKCIFKSKQKLNKSKFECFLKVSMQFLLENQLENMKSYESNINDRSSNDFDSDSNQNSDESYLLVDNFLCLIESLEHIVLNVPLNNTGQFLRISNLGQLFDTLTFYFKYNTIFMRNNFKLAINIESIVLKFLLYIQKFLVKYLINNQFSSNEAENDSVINDETDRAEFKLIVSYFEILFIFIQQNNTNYYAFYMKSSYLKAANSLWSDLNIRLKRSINLSEYLIRNLIKSMIINCYFKRDFLDYDQEISIFIDKNTLLIFNQLLFGFLAEIYSVNNSIGTLNTAYLCCLEYFIKYEKLKMKNHYLSDENLLMNFSEQENACSSFKCCTHLVFDSFDQNSSLLLTLKHGFFYNFLKEFYEKESTISVIEKYLFFYYLLKRVESCKFSTRTNAKSTTLIQDSRRKIKIYLLEELYLLNKQEKNYLQMSFIRKEQADLLEWSTLNKSESELKEILYLKSLKKFAINSLHEKYLNHEELIQNQNDLFLNSIQYDICKELCGYYEKSDQENLSKFSHILNVESKLGEMLSNLEKVHLNAPNNNLQQHGHLFFRIGLFGSALKFDSLINNNYFLYKHKSYEMLSNIQNLILNKLTYSKWHEELENNESLSHRPINKICLLHYNHEPDLSIRQSLEQKCYMQICAVNKIEKSKLIDLIDEMIEINTSFDLKQVQEFRLNLNQSQMYFYFFDRPFYLKSNHEELIEEDDELSFGMKEHESVENLWIERNILLLDNCDESVYISKYENVTQFERIKSHQKIYLNPIRNAINDINEKTKELRNFVIEFTTANNVQPSVSSLNCGHFLSLMHNLQPLTMRLLGCLDARVNGGLIKYIVKLLDNCSLLSLKNTKKKRLLYHQLHSSIKEQLNVLESGLSIHDRILKDVEAFFKRDATLNQQINVSNENTNANSNLDKQQNYFEHVKHMTELNKHLISCLRLIENELSERWSKFN